MIPRIKNVEPKEDKFLKIEFENGEKKLFDVKPYIKEFIAFAPIIDEQFFLKVHVDSSGYAIAWNENIDIDRYDIYEFGKACI